MKLVLNNLAIFNQCLGDNLLEKKVAYSVKWKLPLKIRKIPKIEKVGKQKEKKIGTH